MEMRFSASIVAALNFALRLERGMTGLCTQPCWCNFVFFDRISASPREEWIDPDSDPDSARPFRWQMSRVVEFYYRGYCVAEVFLTGRRSASASLPDGADTFWGISGVEYAQYTSAIRGEPPTDWRTVNLPEHGRMTAGYVGE